MSASGTVVHIFFDGAGAAFKGVGGSAGARQQSDRARARHHHQVALGVRAVHGEGRPDLPPQLHRHPRPRRLQLRGQPLAGRVRGRAAGGGRGPGRGGAVGGQLLHRGGAGAGSGAGAQQDRPAHRRHRAGEGGDRGGDRHRCRRRDCGQRQDRAEHGGRSGGDRHPHPGPRPRRHRQAAGADHRFLVRQLPGRGLAGARGAGRDQER